MITPKLTAIVGTQDIIVSFKVVGWDATADLKDFTVRVEGGGTITQILKKGKGADDVECLGEVTPEGAYFYICNRWNNNNMLVNWGEDYAERSFVVEGATAETQIYFVGDGSYNARAFTGNSRFGFDDVLIVLK